MGCAFIVSCNVSMLGLRDHAVVRGYRGMGKG